MPKDNIFVSLPTLAWQAALESRFIFYRHHNMSFTEIDRPPMLNFLFPDHRFDSITQIHRQWLKGQEIYTMLLDVDCTLKYYRSKTILPDVAAWLSRKQNQGFQFCLVSNGRRGRIERLADELDMPFLAPAYKPFPSSCKRAMRMLHLDPQYTALIGDQVFTDVVAANLAGIRSILVKPLRPQEEPIFARVKRPFERIVLSFEKKEMHQEDL